MNEMKSTGWAVAGCVESGTGIFRRILFMMESGQLGLACAGPAGIPAILEWLVEWVQKLR